MNVILAPQMKAKGSIYTQGKREKNLSKQADLIEKLIEIVMTSYGLFKAFEQGNVRHPSEGAVRKLWRPKKDILHQYYSSGERIVVAILLDAFHEEYGLSDFLDDQSLTESCEKGKRPAELAWPGISSFRQLSILDGTLSRIVADLLVR